MAWTIEAKWLRLLLLGTSVVLCTVSQPGFAELREHWDEEDYPTMGDFLEDCKRAMKAGEANQHAFTSSMCAAHISGFIWTIWYLTAQIPVIGAPKYVEQNPRLKRICFTERVPTGAETESLVPEYWVAKDLIFYINNLNSEELEYVSKQPTATGVIGLLTELYQCKEKEKKDAND